MKNIDLSRVLFDARDKENNMFDFSYTEKIQQIGDQITQIQQQIQLEERKIAAVEKLTNTLEKEVDGIYKTRIEQAKKAKKELEDKLQILENEKNIYQNIQNPEQQQTIQQYIDAKKKSIKDIMTAEQERKVQVMHSIHNRMSEPESQIRELFADDEELLSHINTDKIILLGEKEYTLSNKQREKIDAYSKLIQAWEHYTQKWSEQERYTEDISLEQKLWNIYHNIAEDYKFFAYMRDPEILDKFCKDCLQNIDKDTIPLTDFLMAGKYDWIDPKKIPKKEVQKLQRIGKWIQKLLISNRASIGIVPNKWTKIDDNVLTSVLAGNFDALPSEWAEDQEDSAFEMIAKNMSLDIHMLHAADDYMKSLALIPSKINIDILVPYVQELQETFDQLQKQPNCNRGELYDTYLDILEKHAWFFWEYINKSLQKTPQKYHYILVPLFTEILIATCMVAADRHIGWKWDSEIWSIAAFSTLRAEVICEESIVQNPINNNNQNRKKTNNTLRMLNRMERALDQQKSTYEERLKDPEYDNEKEKIVQLIKSQERDIDMNKTFFWYYNYFVGASNITDIYSILFKENENMSFSEIQWSKVADLYFQNIDWTEIPYDDPMALMSDDFLLKKTNNDYAFETNRSPDDLYKAIIKIGDFDAFAKDEQALNMVRKVLEITHRESKIQDLTSRLSYEWDNLLIRNFLHYAIVFVLHDWSFSINWHSHDSVRVLLGAEQYNILRAYIFRYLLESTNTIDKRAVVWPEKLLPHVPADAGEDFRWKDPRVVYDNNSAENPLLKKIIDYRDDHTRLLAANMFPGSKWFSNAKQYQQPLHAHIYDISADAVVDKPKEKIRIDQYNTYEEMFLACKKLREIYMSDTTIIRFETYVQEFTKDENIERKSKMHYVWRWMGQRIEQTLDSLWTTQ